MGNYWEIKGDLLHLFDRNNFDAIGHSANCFCRMKSGIAGQISKKFEGAVNADNETKCGDRTKLGSFSYWDHANDSRLYNLYAQYNYGREPGHTYLNYEALRRSLENMRIDLQNKLSKESGNLMNIGFPQIGAGLAQGNWEVIKEIIKEVFKKDIITIVIYEPNKILSSQKII